MSPPGSLTLVPELRHSADSPERAQLGSYALVRGRFRALPSFFIAGPPRTGTTWLHAVLARHATLPALTKETRFFDLHFQRGVGWYLDRFPASSHNRPRGEIAPTYFASPAACNRIARIVPRARIVFIFRHPIDRLISLYRLKRAYGLLGWGLDTALNRDPELLDSARYATHLARWQSRFPAGQLLTPLYEDLSADPQGFLDRLADFAGFSRIVLDSSQLAQVAATTQLSEPRCYLATRAATATASWCKTHSLERIVDGVRNSPLMKFFIGAGSPFPQIPARTLERIYRIVLPEIEELESLLQRDLSAWKAIPEELLVPDDWLQHS
jgi:hypothetical protein